MFIALFHICFWANHDLQEVFMKLMRSILLLIDTRNETQYELRHIPLAIRTPDSFDDLARDQEIVAYCA